MSQYLTLFIQELLAPVLIGLKANLAPKIVKMAFLPSPWLQNRLLREFLGLGMCGALESGQNCNHGDPNSNPKARVV